ncbi:MAG TPA: hypothetical protein VM286_06820 [Candidatus Thermoplasmatota archaeon]|nr:hypothetical protein [Candidatus Thermoplasmatota archaeon]
MPASTPACPSRTPSSGRSAHDAGVSEVIGQILIFGIVSVLLVMSMIAFNAAQAGARDRVVALRADSAATRVAGIVVQSSLIAEQQGTSSKITFLVDLPQQIEGLSYTVRLVPKSATVPPVPAHVDVVVPALRITATAPLFSADQPTSFDVCPATVPGGRVAVRFDTRSAAIVPSYPSATPPVAAGCPAGTKPVALFLESTA